MVNYRVTSTILFIIFFSLQFHSNNTLIWGSQLYTLNDLETLVLERNFSIEAVHQKLKAVQYQLDEAKWSLGLELTTRYTYYPENGSMGDEEEEIETEHRAYLRLGQNMVQLLKVMPGLVKEKKAEIEGVEGELEEVKRRALYEFRMEYLEILEEKLQADYSLQLRNTYQDLVNLLKKRYDHKEGLFTDVLEAKNEFNKAQDAFLYHKDCFEKRRRLLAESLGIEAEKIDIEDIRLVPFLPPEERLIDAALKNRGEIKLFETKALQKKERASTAPYEEIKLTPFVGYRLREDRVTGSESGPEVGLSVTIPLNFLKIRKNRISGLRAEEMYWRSEAKRVSQVIKSEIRRVYEKYLLETSRSINLSEGIELEKEKARIEKSKIERPIKGIKADPVNLFRIEAEIKRLNLEKASAQCEIAKNYYGLLYMAGFSKPDELFSSYGRISDLERKTYSRALWVWSVSDLLGDEKAEKFFISFCKIKGIKRIFFSTNKEFLDSILQNINLPSFIANLHQAGIKISALFGEHLWVFPPNRKNLIGGIKLILAYNSISDKTAKFDGIHLDIEPHVLKKWNDEKKELLNLLIETYSEVKEILVAYKTKLQLEVDIPAFYENIDSSLFQKIFAVADVVTVMAYGRKNPERVINSVRSEIQAAVEANKVIIVGLNARDFSNEANLEELIMAVGERLFAYPSFLGFSIHDFNDYRDLSGK